MGSGPTCRGESSREFESFGEYGLMTDALIIDVCRTPRGIGKPGKGALTHIHPQVLGASVLKAIVDRNGIATEEVDDVICGTSSQVAEQKGDLGRMSLLTAGFDQRASGVALDRFCGSGITTVNLGAASIMSGMEDLVIAGGTEMMSMPGRSGSGPQHDGSGQPPASRYAPAVSPGRMCGCYCDY